MTKKKYHCLKRVYVLQHIYNLSGEEEVKHIGTFSSNELAKKIIEDLKKQPGFCDYPDNFEIKEYEIDKTYWIE